jgi:hypothetical protein
MQIQMRVIVAIGAAYFIGYSRGVTASNNLGTQIGEGLNKVGDGLKALAIELGVDFKKYQEEKEEFDQNIVMSDSYTVEEKIRRMGMRRDLYRSDDQIAEKLNTTVEDVKRILDEGAVSDIEGDVVDSTVDEDVRAAALGEPPEKPGSDAT